ncbi:Stk1 family PASTA domain-containing Ser/Thr kinase [Streptomyces sp. NBC_01537]|uniref:Stk1 family PASTA domain-containing Ser/Thr kinase n=1 Tax=Streptomyces sp. NBC_01537 TaxID=2903896 RepID=UPI00386967E1
MDTTLQDPLVGYTLDGRYRVETRIAVGGMATVYRAVDTRLDRVLALKVMHPGLAADRGFVERFIREAKAVARLAHPNVVGVYDQGFDQTPNGTYVFLAMEYVEGCTLRDVLRERGALQPRAALDIMEPVLAGLGAAHRAGLVHRDVKPENVLIGDDGRVKVVDFGLVRGVDTQTTGVVGGGILGTASYMAPEQIESGTTDARTDVYACGLVLYEMLTGSKPHGGETAMQVIYQRLNEDIAPPSATVPGLAHALDGLVAAAAARDAGLRPADAVEMLARLHTARQTLTPEQLDAVPPATGVASEELTAVVPQRRAPASAPDAHRTSLLQSPVPDTRRRPRADRGNRRVVALVAAVLLVLGLGTGAVWYIADGQFTRTPAVLGEPQAQAVRELRAAGLEVTITQDFSEAVARGRVIGTDPGPGGRVRENGTVTLNVSKGPERVRVPDVTGKTLAVARAQLRKAGLTPGTVTRVFSDEVDAGEVISTDPKSGTTRSPDSAIALTVSKGEPVDAPDVVGDLQADAEQTLTDAGLKFKVAATPVYSDEADAGAVAEQNPAADTQLARGDTVTLTLSKGQEMIVVPDVEGKDVDEAKQILQDAGFDVRVIRYFITGKVTSQSPGAGESAAKGSTITLWVS